MELKIGQRWRFNSTGLIIEILDPKIGKCIVVGKQIMYPIGYIGSWLSALQESTKGADYIQYLSGQDRTAPDTGQDSWWTGKSIG
jgi:hypothetical protein